MRFNIGDIVRIAKTSSNEVDKELDDKDLYWRDEKINGVVICNDRPDRYSIEVRFDEWSEDCNTNIFAEESLRLVKKA